MDYEENTVDTGTGMDEAATADDMLSDEVVEEGREKGPDQRPEQHTEERRAETAAPEGKKLSEVAESDPGKEMGRRLMLRVIIGEGHADHEDQRQHCKNEDAEHRNREQRLVKMAVQKRA